VSVSKELVTAIRKSYRLDWNGIHGVAHWSRVRDIGLRLAEKTGANPLVVELFAFIHDSQRHDDGYDPEHGKRAVKFARGLRERSIIEMADAEFNLLTHACELHTFGETEGDVTVLTCWDADRLDLGRVGIVPIAEKLCTHAAKNPSMLEWAYKRSIS